MERRARDPPARAHAAGEHLARGDDQAGDESRTFAATPAGRPGFYRASVKFPHAGNWHYVVDDGFTARHPYPAVAIGAGDGNAERERGGAATDGRR